MTTEFTEENFSILFDEQKKLVEVRYQGVNADALATLSTRVDGLETELDAALASSSGSIGTLSTSLGSLSTLVTALAGTVNADQLARIAGDEANAADTLSRHNIAMAAIEAETTTRAAALLAEAAARGAAITNATATIITDVATLATTVSGLAASVGGNTASIISVQDALATETSTRASQYASLLADYGNTNAAILSESTVRASTDSALAAQIDALAATSGTNVFTQPDEPTTGMIAGDIWYDTDDGNKPYRYDGVNWVDVTDVRITQNAAAIVAEQIARANGDSANATSITTLTSKVNLKTRTFAQNSAPVSDGTYTLVVGDLWIDLDSVPANKMFRWNGSSWVDAENADIAQNKADIIQVAQTAASDTDAVAQTVDTLTAVVNVKTRTFSQATAPVSDGSYTLVVGDLWIDTDSVPANQMYRWNGSSWVASRDGGIQQAIGMVEAESLARANDIGEIEAKYTVKVTAGNRVAGFGLIATSGAYGAGDSEFWIDASTFKVWNGSSAVAPFYISGGVVYMQNVVIQNAQIQSLTMTKVTAGAIMGAMDGSTSGAIRFGKSYYGDSTNGIYLGYSGGYVFDIGNSSQYMRWSPGSGLQINGATLTLSGAGGYTRYLGVDVASTYIDWYGSGSVTDANAKFFIKKDGTAMFSGRIRGEFEPKMWCAIYGEATPYFKDKFNCSSISKLGTGKYRVYFYSALPNANYAAVASGSDPAKAVILTVAAQTTTYVDVYAQKRGDGNYIDISILNIIVFGSNVPTASGGSNEAYPYPVYDGGTYGGGPIP